MVHVGTLADSTTPDQDACQPRNGQVNLRNTTCVQPSWEWNGHGGESCVAEPRHLDA